MGDGAAPRQSDVARLAALLGIAILGAIVAAPSGDGADSSVGALHLAMAIGAGRVAPGGIVGLAESSNPQRKARAGCPGGQLPAPHARPPGTPGGAP